MLDYVRRELAALEGKVAAEDRPRLQQHADLVRDLEQRIARVTSASCTGGAAPDGSIDVNANDSFPVVGKLHMDLIVRALGCDLTRVAVLQWSASLNQIVFTWEGNTTGHHSLSHGSGTRDEHVRVYTWYAKQLAYLIEQLKATPDAGGKSVFDNTVIAWVSEIGDGSADNCRRVPFVLAGSAGGYFRTGRYIKYPSVQPHNNLLVSLCNAMGVDVTTFGQASVCTGPLEGLRT